MTLLALTAPATSNYVSDPQFTVATGTSITAAETALTGNTGFTVPWVKGLTLHIQSGATAAGNVTLVNPGGGPSLTVNMAANADILYGPIRSGYANATGLIQVNVTTVTTAAAGAYLMPGSTGPAHNPFETNPSKADY